MPNGPNPAMRIWINGHPVTTENATVSVLDRGFLYGDSVFETLRTYGGKPFALGSHVSRLFESAERVLIRVPVSPEVIAGEIEDAVKEAAFDESYIRLMVTRGVGAFGLDPHACETPTRVLLVTPLTPPPLAAYRTGIKAVTFETTRLADDTPAAGAKVGNYLVAVLAQDKARKAGAGEALIKNAAGQIVEGATSNVFWLRGETLFTPPLSAGILDGVTRRHLLSAASAVGIQVEMAVADTNTLISADAVFISSSIREILSIVSIDDEQVGSGKVHPTVAKIHAEFRRLVGAPA